MAVINPAGLVYGVLAVATVVAAESTRRETFPAVVEASVLTICLYWLAHAYARHLGSRLGGEGPDGGEGLPAALLHEAAILAGASVPLLAVLGAWAAGAGLETAVTAALWTAAVELVVLEVGAGLRRHLSLRELALETLVGGLMGLGILGVRLILH